MPYSPTFAIPVINTSLASVGNIGQGATKFASGVAFGIENWIHTIKVTTVDTGTLGAGVGAIPLIIPNPVLFTSLSIQFIAQGIIGVMAPLTVTGLTNGIVTALATAIVSSTHPSVGTGSAVVRFSPGPSTQGMIQGFQSQQMNTPASIKMATAIAQALDIVFASLVLVSPIVGPSSPTGSSGVGSGSIL